MATTTPNFGWSVPTSTDLVKDGATAIETLGDAIDASMADLKGGTTGQVLKKNSGTDMDFVWSADSAGMTNPMTTTGDIIYSSSGSTPARLGIGTSGQVLNVAAGVPAWTTPSGAALVLISTTTMAAVASQAVDGCFTSTYSNYVMMAKISTSTDSTNVTFRFRKSGTPFTGSYYYSGFSHSSSSSTYANKWAGDNSSAIIQNQAGNIPYVTNINATIYSPQIATERQAIQGGWVSIDYNLGGGLWAVAQSTDSYDGFDLTPAAGTLTGTVSIYGVAK